MSKFGHVPVAALFLMVCTGCATVQRLPNARSGAALETLQARYAIEQLQARYFEIVDLFENQREGRPSAAAAADELFTPDATWTLYADGQVITEQASFTGREQLIDLMTQLEGRYVPGVYIKHVSTNARIEVTGATARATEQLLMLVSDKNKHVANWYLGYYDDVLQLDASGAWKFKAKTLRMEDLTHWTSLRETERQ